MLVTPNVASESAVSAATSLSEEWRWSIRLAIAQWLRSAAVIIDAQQHLLALGTDSDEILRRRRADSTDSALKAVLRLAVTIIISRGRLEREDRAKIRGLVTASTFTAIVEATADAYARVLRAETRGDPTTSPGFVLDVGDY